MLSFLVGIALATGFGPMAPDAPAHEPQMAVNGSTVALVFGAGKGVYFSMSADSGKTFSAPIKVAESEIVPVPAGVWVNEIVKLEGYVPGATPLPSAKLPGVQLPST